MLTRLYFMILIAVISIASHSTESVKKLFNRMPMNRYEPYPPVPLPPPRDVYNNRGSSAQYTYSETEINEKLNEALEKINQAFERGKLMLEAKLNEKLETLKIKANSKIQTLKSESEIVRKQIESTINDGLTSLNAATSIENNVRSYVEKAFNTIEYKKKEAYDSLYNKGDYSNTIADGLSAAQEKFIQFVNSQKAALQDLIASAIPKFKNYIKQCKKDGDSSSYGASYQTNDYLYKPETTTTTVYPYNPPSYAYNPPKPNNYPQTYSHYPFEDQFNIFGQYSSEPNRPLNQNTDYKTKSDEGYNFKSNDAYNYKPITYDLNSNPSNTYNRLAGSLYRASSENKANYNTGDTMNRYNSIYSDNNNYANNQPPIL